MKKDKKVSLTERWMKYRWYRIFLLILWLSPVFLTHHKPTQYLFLSCFLITLISFWKMHRKRMKAVKDDKYVAYDNTRDYGD